MLDLKAQLAAAGLVTKEQIEAVEAKSRRSSKPKSTKSRGRRAKGGKGGKGSTGLDPAALAAAGKGERYEMIRRAVNASRLDSAGPIPSADSEPFHFLRDGGAVGRVFVEAPLRARLEGGKAVIVAYMSNHGLAHAVVPVALGRGIAEVFPEWLRVLREETGAKAEPEIAGESEAGVEPETPSGASGEGQEPSA